MGGRSLCIPPFCMFTQRLWVQLLGLVGSPGKGKHASFERVRRGMNDICGALQAQLLTPHHHLADLERHLHAAQVLSLPSCLMYCINLLTCRVTPPQTLDQATHSHRTKLCTHTSDQATASFSDNGSSCCCHNGSRHSHTVWRPAA